VLVKVPVGVSSDARRAGVSPASLSPETIVRPRVSVAVRIGHGKEVPVSVVEESLVVGQVFGKFVDGEESGGGSNPLAGVEDGVEEDAILACAVGDFDNPQWSTFGGSSDVDDGHEFWECGGDFIDVCLDLWNNDYLLFCFGDLFFEACERIV
jgi:hypothetical protein